MVLKDQTRRSARAGQVLANGFSTRLAVPACIGFWVSMSLIGSTPALADEDSLQEVTISANRLEEELPQELSKYGVRVDTISAAQIRDGGYTDVAQALQALAPGLYISPKNGPFDYVDVSLQGSSTGDILWLVDGVRVNNRLYNGTTPLDTMPAAMVERIEVLEGGEALFYGTQAIAGAVNIVTKAFSDTPDGAITAAADSNNGKHIDAYARDAVGKSQFVVYGSGDQSSGYQPFRAQDYQPSSTDHDRGYSEVTLGVKYAYNFTDDLRLSIAEQHTEGRVDDAAPQQVAIAYNDRDEDLLSAKLDAKLNDMAQLFVKTYFHSWRSHYTEFDNTIPPSDVLEVSDNHDAWGYKDYGANVMAQLQLGKNFDSFVGYDVQNYGGKDAVLVITQHTESTQALFAQIRTRPELFTNLKLAVGLRYSDPSVGQSATVWNVNGQYDLGTGWFVRGQIGTAFRLPTAEELFANDPEDERGNPNLKPETSTNANLSVGGAADVGATQAKWELIGFYRDVKNLIDYATFDADTDQDVFGNVPGTVRVRGAELALDWSLARMVSASANFTYNHAIDPSTDQQIGRVPKQLLKVALDLHPQSQPWGATLTVNHTGTTYATGLWDGTESYGDTTVVDLAGRYFIDAAHRQRIDLSVQNLFDLAYASRLGTATRDDDGSNYTYWNLGLPRTWRVAYSYGF